MYAAILVVGLINVISYTDFSRNAQLNAGGDAISYIRMSEHTFSPVPNPFALRMLSPLIVHELVRFFGLGLNSSWLLLTFAATSAALIFFFKLLYDHFGLTLFTSTIFTILLAFTNYYTFYNYRDIWLVDPLNNLFYVLAITFVLQQRLIAFAAVILLGSVNKETTLLLAPLYPILAWARSGKLDNPEVKRGASALGIAVIFYVLYHLWVQACIGVHGSSYAMLSGQNGHSILENLRTSLNTNKGQEQWNIFQVFYFLWLLFGYGVYRLYKEFGARNDLLIISGYLLVAVMFGRLFATDAQRVYVMMAQVVFCVCALVLDRFRSESKRLWIVVLSFIYIALNFQWLSQQPAIAANFIAILIMVIVFGDEGPNTLKTFRFPNANSPNHSNSTTLG